jgi:hypothetical protein
MYCVLAPLKLSAPTSLMQNANTDATLVCHANKPFEKCIWTTPYGAIFIFEHKSTRMYENGRISFFKFSTNDCGIVIKKVSAQDNGKWICNLLSTSGKISQNATDLVSLYIGK